MAKKKENWRERSRRLIRLYPGLQRKDRDLRECRITPTYSGMPGGGGDGRSMENIALRRLPRDEQRAFDAVRLAISTTARYTNGKQRLRVIELVYWKKTYDLHGAAMKCHYSYDAVQGWNADFIELVDAYWRVL